MLLARDLDLVPIGTMAHEFLQTYQALGVRLRDFQKAALEDWVQEYRGDLGIALTDTVGMGAHHQPLNLVMKLTRANGQLVAQLSDTPGKTLCEDETYLASLKQVFHLHAH